MFCNLLHRKKSSFILSLSLSFSLLFSLSGLFFGLSRTVLSQMVHGKLTQPLLTRRNWKERLQVQRHFVLQNSIANVSWFSHWSLEKQWHSTISSGFQWWNCLFFTPGTHFSKCNEKHSGVWFTAWMVDMAQISPFFKDKSSRKRDSAFVQAEPNLRMSDGHMVWQCDLLSVQVRWESARHKQQQKSLQNLSTASMQPMLSAQFVWSREDFLVYQWCVFTYVYNLHVCFDCSWIWHAVRSRYVNRTVVSGQTRYAIDVNGSPVFRKDEQQAKRRENNYTLCLLARRWWLDRTLCLPKKVIHCPQTAEVFKETPDMKGISKALKAYGPFHVLTSVFFLASRLWAPGSCSWARPPFRNFKRTTSE